MILESDLHVPSTLHVFGMQFSKGIVFPLKFHDDSADSVYNTYNMYISNLDGKSDLSLRVVIF